MLNNGADINALCKVDITALIIACDPDRMKIVNTLFEEEADVSVFEGAYKIALIAASSRGGERIVRELISTLLGIPTLLREDIVKPR